MSAARDDIIEFCDELLEVEAFEDYGPNGLQLPGDDAVARVATGVSVHRELIERAVASGARLLLAHHGLFWSSQPRTINPTMAARLRVALQAGLSIAAYHLPLDAHPGIGNNALLRAALGFEASPEALGMAKGRPIGVVGRSSAGLPIGELVARVRTLTGRDPLVFAGGPDSVRSIGIVSGGGAGMIHEATRLGLDAFLTGEPAEHVMADAREGGVHFIAAGHYATETFGIRKLGETVAERFGIEHEFIDIPNPV